MQLFNTGCVGCTSVSVCVRIKTILASTVFVLFYFHAVRFSGAQLNARSAVKLSINQSSLVFLPLVIFNVRLINCASECACEATATPSRSKERKGETQ